MCKKLRIGLCFFVIILMVSASGCWWAGAGTMHVPRDIVRCDQLWDVRVMYTNDPKDWRVNLEEEAGNFMVRYHVSSSDGFDTVPMMIEKLEPKLGRAYLKAEMPVIPCDCEYVEYYYDHVTSYNHYYNRSPIYKAVVRD